MTYQENGKFTLIRRMIPSDSSFSVPDPLALPVRYAAEVLRRYDLGCTSIAEELILVFCESGSARLHLCGRTYLMESGFCACILPNDCFSITPVSPGKEPYCNCIFLLLSPDSVADGLVNSVLISRLCIRDLILSPQANMRITAARFSRISADGISGFGGDELALRYVRNESENLLMDFLMQALVSVRRAVLLYGGRYRIAKNAAIHAVRCFRTSPLFADEIAAKLHVIPAYFSKVFKESTGIGYAAYVRGLRLHLAASLLASSILPIKEISTLCLIRSPAYLTHEFSKQYGMTPKVYRGRYRNGNGGGDAF